MPRKIRRPPGIHACRRGGDLLDDFDRRGKGYSNTPTPRRSLRKVDREVSSYSPEIDPAQPWVGTWRDQVIWQELGLGLVEEVGP
jgi:hypothetical protein